MGLIALGGDFGIVFEAQVHVDASAAIGIVERQGLQKIRHIEVDLLWIQEMEMRRLLPLAKIWGELNPADLMTKNVPIEKVMTFTKSLRLTFDTGRAGAAAQLHAIAGPGDEDKEDEWTARGEQRVWIRNHNQWRRELFTPYGVSGGPDAGTKFKTTRITTGVTEDGCRFQISDNWRDLDSSHRQLESRWVGTTAFEQKYTNGAPAAQTRIVIDSVLQQPVPGGKLMGSLTRVDRGIGKEYNLENRGASGFDHAENFDYRLRQGSNQPRCVNSKHKFGIFWQFENVIAAAPVYIEVGSLTQRTVDRNHADASRDQADLSEHQFAPEPFRAQYTEHSIRDHRFQGEHVEHAGGSNFEVSGDGGQEVHGVNLSGSRAVAWVTSHLALRGEGESLNEERPQPSRQEPQIRDEVSRGLFHWDGVCMSASDDPLAQATIACGVSFWCAGKTKRATPSPAKDLIW